MENLIVSGVLAIIFGLAIWKIIAEKKRGAKCIGCPHAGTHGTCSSNDDKVQIKF